MEFIDSQFERSTKSLSEFWFCVSIVTLISALTISFPAFGNDGEQSFKKLDAPLISQRIKAESNLPLIEEFIAEDLAITSGPVDTPLELSIPALAIDTEVVGVGMTKRKAMDAPTGKVNDPVWQQSFWYRGSAIPGDKSTSLIAGHAIDPLGRAGIFAYLDQLVTGDEILVKDTRDNTVLRFAVDEVKTYTLNEVAQPANLEKIYGTGPVGGNVPEVSGDAKSHLTLITCAGVFKGVTHDKRLVVYATRVS